MVRSPRATGGQPLTKPSMFWRNTWSYVLFAVVGCLGLLMLT